MFKIIDHLFISSYEVAQNKKLLIKNNVKHVVSIGCEYMINPHDDDVDVDDDSDDGGGDNDTIKTNDKEEEVDVDDEKEEEVVDFNSSAISSTSSSSSSAAAAAATSPSLTGIIAGNIKDDTINYLIFPHLLDSPDTLILDIINQSNRFIHTSITCNQNILVHCQHGQSRSATIITMYLISTGKYDLLQAITLMKGRNPHTCINPGFLSQLYFLSICDDLKSPLFRLLRITHSMDPSVRCINYMSPSSSKSPPYTQAMLDGVYCMFCNHFLCRRENIIKQSINTMQFVNQHVDPFWKDYHAHDQKTTSLVILPIKKTIVVTPEYWMYNQVNSNHTNHDDGDDDDDVIHMDRVGINESLSSSDQYILRCPGCSYVCGYSRKKCLDIIGHHCVADLYALHEKYVKIKRNVI